MATSFSCIYIHQWSLTLWLWYVGSKVSCEGSGKWRVETRKKCATKYLNCHNSCMFTLCIYSYPSTHNISWNGSNNSWNNEALCCRIVFIIHLFFCFTVIYCVSGTSKCNSYIVQCIYSQLSVHNVVFGVIIQLLNYCFYITFQNVAFKYKNIVIHFLDIHLKVKTCLGDFFKIQFYTVSQSRTEHKKIFFSQIWQLNYFLFLCFWLFDFIICLILFKININFFLSVCQYSL